MGLPLVELIGIAIGLAMDATAVAIAGSISLGKVSRRQLFRFAFHFGLFQAMMPVLGWLIGNSFSHYIVSWDHWVAFGLLAAVGGRGVYEALRGDEETKDTRDPTKGISLIVLSIATSIDALAVGLSFAMLNVRIWLPAVLIGVITATLTAAGMLLGARLGMKMGRRMKLIGGIVLIAIGVKIVLEHTLLG